MIRRLVELTNISMFALIHSAKSLIYISLTYNHLCIPGLSYVMDFSTSDDIQEEDEVDVYENEGIQCVVDAKSLLYLYGLELDYSEDLIGGGFKFFNPNAEESCVCGSSFGV